MCAGVGFIVHTGGHRVTSVAALHRIWYTRFRQTKEQQKGTPTREQSRHSHTHVGTRRLRQRVRVDIIGHFEPCMTEISLYIDARMAEYIRTHP